MNPRISSQISTAVTALTKHDAIAPIVALEATVTLGRTRQAYKRGGKDEARERFIEETMGAVVWLTGVGAMNKLGDKIVAKILKKPNANFDVGTDKILRKPFENFMTNKGPKGFSPKQVAMIKGAKVLTSVIITNLFIGFVVPKLNQALTNQIRHKRKEQALNKDKVDLSTKQPVFKGGYNGAINMVNTFTNCIENTTAGKLLSSDAGIAGGRMYNARTKEERREVAIRDIGSIYFYMWAQGHVRNGLNLVESGKATRLNPETTKLLDEHLNNFLKDKEISVEEFKKAVIGEKVRIPENIPFETAKTSSWDKLTKNKPLKVFKLSDVEKVITDKESLERIREMSKLQPLRVGEAVLTEQQLIDSLNKAEINDPKFLDKVFTEFTGGANKEEYRFISNKQLEKLKSEMEQYVETICKASKDGKINKQLLEKVKNKNLIFNGINFLAGFTVAATFLSTIIPKFQYYVTRKTTGIDAFPGLYDYEHHCEVEA